MRRDGPDAGDELVTPVEVTQQYIDDGRRAEACRLSRECNCPVAHAVAAAGFDNPKVRASTFTAGDVTGYLHSGGKRRRYVLPPEAVRFIERFDESLHVDPITFEVDETDYVNVFYE